MNKKKKILIIACIALVVCLIAGVTIALLKEDTDVVVNTFDSNASTDIKVEETFDGNTKSDVYVKVDGDVASYIRANVVITLTDDSGNIVTKAPAEGTDYTIEYGTDWTR